MKQVKHIFNIVIWTLAGLYLVIAIMVHIPVVQSFLSHEVASALARKLGTTVSVGRVDVGFLNRLIVDDVTLLDQKGKPMLRATRLSVKMSYVALMQGRISITSAQLFGMKANLYRASADSPLNCQFALDSLASKDTTAHKPLDLQINSLIIRHGEVAYNQLDAPSTATFSPRHLHVSDISAHVILNALRDDSLNVNLKKLALNERSGLRLKAMSFKLEANAKGAELTDFSLRLPHSSLSADRLAATYQIENKKIIPATLQYEGSINTSTINPSDLTFLSSSLKKYTNPIVLAVSFTGTSTSLRIPRLEAIIARDRRATSLRSPSIAHVLASGSLSSWNVAPRWAATISDLTASEQALKLLSSKLPKEISRMGSISYRGEAGGYGHDMALKGVVRSEAGNAQLALGRHGDQFNGRLVTEGFNIGHVLDNDQLGMLAANINVDGNIRRSVYQAKGRVQRLDYHGYTYLNITVDGAYSPQSINGKLSINDPNIVADVEGAVNTGQHNPATRLTADIRHINPTALGLTGSHYAGTIFGGLVDADFTGNTLNTANGRLTVNRFFMKGPEKDYSLSSLEVKGQNDAGGHTLTLNSDFARAELTGRFDYSTLWQNLENLVVSKLPSVQQLTALRYRPTRANHFTVNATVTRADWLRQLLDIPVELGEPMTLSGRVGSHADDTSLRLEAPDITYGDRHLRYVSATLSTPADRLDADLRLTTTGGKGPGTDYRLRASANNDKLTSALAIDNHATNDRMRGQLNSVTQFGRTANGLAEAHVDIQPSTIYVGDTTLQVHPSTIVYSKGRLQVSNVAISSGGQHITINGQAAKGSDDSITVDLKNVNVDYVMDLVNFHSVGFSGFATGRAYLTHLFDGPGGHAQLSVSDFCLEDGPLGTLQAAVAWNPQQEQIDIDAQAVDTIGHGSMAQPGRLTTIKGYVSPQRGDIDLAITPHNTRGTFIEHFCSSFMNRSDLSVDGALRLWGDLKQLKLTGQTVVSGKMGITPLNTVYTLPKDTIRFLTDEIQFPHCVIRDRDGNEGLVTGSVSHHHLSRFAAELRMHLDHMLGYDWDGSDGSTFYGTVYGTGNVGVKTRPGEIDIEVNVTPERGSQIVYNASTPDAVGSQDFIHWTDSHADSLAASIQTAAAHDDDDDDIDIPSDIRINFLINTTPEATLKLIMDNASGDYIALNGSGVLRASYYNKGATDVFGNYIIDHGIYKLTIQNVLKRDFLFEQGGTIVFGGDPYQAALNLTAQYPVNSVSLADLQLGRSFSSNNIRVNCLMNITGTPSAPKVDFNLDMPTVGTDAKQMIYSIINSEEEMNQQVLYLLAVGRFYAPGSNNAVEEQTGSTRTSLTMQSILSGQISQQLNNVLSSVIKNNNWNFGANISTGDEGFNNAEYEGLLSGRLLNNRLLFNGQFGYRDNANATTSFIGDFDLRYLITPNGNLSMHVYNQTNDRYFTRNSLNTQGLGFIVKRDFNGWRDLWSRSKARRRQEKKARRDSTTVAPAQKKRSQR